MYVSQVMRPHPEQLSPTASILDAAEIMKDMNVGSVPIVSGGRLIGVLTDHDIVVRGLAEGCDLQSDVADVMCEEVWFVRPTDDVTRARELMRDRRLGRLPVVDESGELVGTLSLGDLEAGATKRLT